MKRPTRESVMMQIAFASANRSTCARRDVGCVLTNEKGHVIATGYNGVASGMKHCKGGDKCGGSTFSSSEGLDKCEAIHAEQNALLQCKDVYDIDTCYSTTEPCIHCIKLLLNTSCKRIIFSQSYPNNELARELWSEAGRTFENIVDYL